MAVASVEEDSAATAVAGAPLFPDQPVGLFRNLSEHTKDKIKLLGSDDVHRVVKGQIPEDLKPGLEEDFTESELFEIAHMCDVYVASKGNMKPKALWIFGPPAVGKTTVTNERAGELFGQEDNAVTIDGDIFRSVHKGFQMAVMHGLRNRLVHEDAWTTLKNSGHMDKIKEAIVLHAVENRQNLKIPEAANKPERVNGMLEKLVSAGYEMHAICLWAPKSVTVARGRPRSVKEGKAFNPKMYDGSTKSTLHFGHLWEKRMKEGNVHFASVTYYDNTVFPSNRVNMHEFEMFTSMTDEEATDHAKRCQNEKHKLDACAKIASEARDKGAAPRNVLRAMTSAWETSDTPDNFGKRMSPRSSLSKVSESKDSIANAISRSWSLNRSWTASDVSRTSRSVMDPAVFLAELQRCRLEGFVAGVAVSGIAATLYFSARRLAFGLKP